MTTTIHTTQTEALEAVAAYANTVHDPDNQANVSTVEVANSRWDLDLNGTGFVVVITDEDGEFRKTL